MDLLHVIELQLWTSALIIGVIAAMLTFLTLELWRKHTK